MGYDMLKNYDLMNGDRNWISKFFTPDMYAHKTNGSTLEMSNGYADATKLGLAGINSAFNIMGNNELIDMQKENMGVMTDLARGQLGMEEFRFQDWYNNRQKASAFTKAANNGANWRDGSMQNTAYGAGGLDDTYENKAGSGMVNSATGEAERIDGMDKAMGRTSTANSAAKKSNLAGSSAFNKKVT